MAFWDVLIELLILLSAALTLGIVCEWLRQSAVVGYILAGMLLGPHVLDWVEVGPDVLRGVADLGVSLLLFAVGLEFSLKRLMRIGPIGIGGGSAQVLVTLGLGALIAGLVIGRTSPALAWGAMLALSSTACVFRVLADRAALDSPYGRGAAGILLLQDLAVVPLVLLVGALGETGSGEHGSWAVHVFKDLGLIVALTAGFFLLNRYVLPRLLNTAVVQRNRELWILLAAVVAMGSASAAHAVGVSPALGAFIAGVMLAESPFALQVRSDVGALRTLFMTMFFATIGMLGDPLWIAAHPARVAGVTAALIFGKAAIITVVGLLFRMRLGSAIAMGLALAQVGEFSFVLAEVARDNGAIDAELFRLFISVTLLTLLATPYLIAWGPRLGRAVEWALRRPGTLIQPTDDEAVGPRHRDHVVVVGFGPAGQDVVEAVLRRGQEAVVIDLKSENLRVAEQLGATGYIGDAVDPHLMQRAGAAHARAVVITLPDMLTAAEAVIVLRWEAPGVPILVRARQARFIEDLYNAGASVVIDEEQAAGRRLDRALRQIKSPEASSDGAPGDARASCEEDGGRGD